MILRLNGSRASRQALTVTKTMIRSFLHIILVTLGKFESRTLKTVWTSTVKHYVYLADQWWHVSVFTFKYYLFLNVLDIPVLKKLFSRGSTWLTSYTFNVATAISRKLQLHLRTFSNNNLLHKRHFLFILTPFHVFKRILLRIFLSTWWGPTLSYIQCRLLLS